jgi:NAD(P)-dependent dehydrogenase (short-subunit alcohol dehydrogenase family)
MFLAYGRHGDDAEEAAAEVRALGRRAATAAADLSYPAAPSRLVEQATATGLHGLARHLAPRVAAHGVTVNVLVPALIGETRMLPLGPDFDGTPVPIPVGRVGRPDEVAELAIAMLGNGYLINKVVTLDGGLLPR